MLIIGVRKYRPKLVWRCKVYWIIEARILTHAALETPRAAINLAEQLDL